MTEVTGPFGLCLSGFLAPKTAFGDQITTDLESSNSKRTNHQKDLWKVEPPCTKIAPGAFKAMLRLEEYLHQCGLEESLFHLVKLRASQINGCAYCIDMHWKDLRAIGESEPRLYGLDA
jgi:AhpD family alkylhydroperoxidase